MPDTIQTKTCSKCKEIKTFSEFHKDPLHADGLQSRCKNCNRKYKQTERGRQAIRKYRQSEFGKAAERKYKQNNPAKVKARSAIANAIRDGRFLPPTDFKCQDCGEQADQYHHWRGYEPEYWFDVIPVCRKCHIELDRSLGDPCTGATQLSVIIGD